MKEVISGAMNVTGRLGDGAIAPLVECVLVVSEPVYTVDMSGGLVKSRVTEGLRFTTTAAGLRSLAALFTEWANQAEEEVSLCVEAIRAKPEAA